jgi:flagellar biosynthesis/type III secretory pathway M-ring protein FliF/YscJ
MKELVQLAGAAVGVDSSRGDLLAVENISFRVSAVETPAPPSKLEKIRALLRDWADALRYVGVTLLFLFVYLVVLRPVKKQALAAFRQIPARAQAAAAGAGFGTGVGTGAGTNHGAGLGAGSGAGLGTASLAAGSGTGSGERAGGDTKNGAMDMAMDTDEGRRAKLLKQQLADRVKAEPAAAGRLVQNWMREG